MSTDLQRKLALVFFSNMVSQVSIFSEVDYILLFSEITPVMEENEKNHYTL